MTHHIIPNLKRKYKIETSNVKNVAFDQRQAKADSAITASVPSTPKEGWIRTLRKAIDMSGAQLAEYLGYSRNKVSILERREADGDITLNQLRALAEGLDATLVYAIVPKNTAEETIDKQAYRIAKQQVEMSNQNMFLEAQQISSDKQENAIKRMMQEIKNIGGKVLWDKENKWNDFD
ncbi:MAG: putative DNA-binding mobile mystery protein A [Glaciecola sp.]|jgi:predicted DNA-binding mobile mystery protein A